MTLKLQDESEFLLPETLAKALLALAKELSVGHAIRLLPFETTLTPAETAKMLGLSRPFVVRLLVVRMAAGKHRPPRTSEDLADVLHEGSGPRPSVSADLAVLELLGLEQTKQTGAEPGGLAPGGELVEKPVRSGSPDR